MKEEINLSALQVLIQKEVQNRKVYQDAESFLNGILGLKQYRGELQKEVDRLQDAKISAIDEAKKAKDEQVAAAGISAEILLKAKKEAEEIKNKAFADADKKAGDILGSARARAENEVSSYSDKISRLKKQLDDLYIEQSELKGSIATLSTELAERQKTLIEIRAKFKALGD